MMRKGFVLTVCVVLMSAPLLGGSHDVCTNVTGPKALPGLPEASGLTLSRRTPGLLWSHNDSGEPVIVAFDATAGVRGRVRIPNATVEDWEDISAARCATGPCLYIADIGDNNGKRRHITVYRLPEPSPQDKESAAPDVFTAVYPDGPHDAEALFVAGDDLFVITKEATGRIYRFPKPLRGGADLKLERVGELPLKHVTDADVSVDGAWVAVRTNEEVVFYRTAELMKGQARGIAVSLHAVHEPQGEGVALDANGTLYLTSEAGGAKRAGSLVTLRCTLSR